MAKNVRHKAIKSAGLSVGLAVFLLIFSIFAFYWRSLNNPIFFDTAQNFSPAMLKDVYENFSLFRTRNLPYFTFGLFYKWIGEDWYWHNLFNVVLHALNCVLLFFLIKKLFLLARDESKETHWPIQPVKLAFIATLFFGLNPVGVYAVGYLIQRTILMATLFGLAMLLSYFKGVSEKRPTWLLASVLFYFLAIYSKEHSIMLPAVALLLTRFCPNLSWRELIKKYYWVFVLYAVVGLSVILSESIMSIYGRVYEPHGMQILQNMAERGGDKVTLKHAWFLSGMTQCTMFFRYLFLWLVPYVNWIYIDIGLPFATSLISWPETFFTFIFFLYGVLFGWLLLKQKGVNSLLGFGMLIPWVLFATEFSTVRVSEEFVLYRSYLWMVGLYFILPALLSRKVFGRDYDKFKIIFLSLYLIVVVGVACDRLASLDSPTLVWQDAVDKLESSQATAIYKSYRPYNNLAFSQTAEGKLDEAITNYYKAIQINSNYVKARSNLGAVLVNKGRYEEAIQNFKHALEVDPKFIDAWVGLGVCAENQGLYEDAKANYEQAFKIAPHYPDALYNMGNVYLHERNLPQAEKYYLEAIKYNPTFANSHHNLGMIYINQGRVGDAKSELKKALEIDPNHKLAKEALADLEKSLPKNFK